MNTANFPAMILALSLPCAAAPAPAPEYSAKHRETASKLAVQQDELQADTSDLILGETNEEVVDLLKKCRHAMNDAVDLLEVYNTGGQTLAAQSDVIELIYQAAKAKMTGADGRTKHIHSQQKCRNRHPAHAGQHPYIPRNRLSLQDCPLSCRRH